MVSVPTLRRLNSRSTRRAERCVPGWHSLSGIHQGDVYFGFISIGKIADHSRPLAVFIRDLLSRKIALGFARGTRICVWWSSERFHRRVILIWGPSPTHLRLIYSENLTSQRSFGRRRVHKFCSWRRTFLCKQNNKTTKRLLLITREITRAL